MRYPVGMQRFSGPWHRNQECGSITKPSMIQPAWDYLRRYTNLGLNDTTCAFAERDRPVRWLVGAAAARRGKRMTKLQKIVMHVGPPKTGTKSIQYALSSVQQELEATGIYYPNARSSGDGGHPSLAWDLLSGFGYPIVRFSRDELTWSDALQQARHAEAEVLLVSSEGFSHFDELVFAKLKSVVGDVPVTLVFGLRDPTRLVPSIWQEVVKSGFGAGEELLDLDDAINVLI